MSDDKLFHFSSCSAYFNSILSFSSDPMDVDKDTRSIDHPPSLVKVLRGHQSEVFTCAWSPVANVIVSG